MEQREGGLEDSASVGSLVSRVWLAGEGGLFEVGGIGLESLEC